MGAGIQHPNGGRMQEALSEPQVSTRNVILAVAPAQYYMSPS